MAEKTNKPEVSLGSPGEYRLTVVQAADVSYKLKTEVKGAAIGSILRWMRQQPETYDGRLFASDSDPDPKPNFGNKLVVFNQQTGDCVLYDDLSAPSGVVLRAELVPNKRLLAWQLNGHGFLHNQLRDLVRYNRDMLKDVVVADLIASLESFNADVHKQIELLNKQDGTQRSAKVQRDIVVKTMPTPFKLHCPLYVGEAPETLDVQVRFEEHENGTVVLCLECERLAEITENALAFYATALDTTAVECGYLFVLANDSSQYFPQIMPSYNR